MIPISLNYPTNAIRIAALVLLTTTAVVAQPTLGPASGGADISADTYVAATFTALTGPVITETNPGQLFQGGTIVLTAPAGWEFDTGGANPSVAVTLAPGFTGTTKLTAGFSGRTATTITFTILNSSDDPPARAGRLTFSGIRVRPTVGIAPNNGDIRNTGTTAPTGVSNYGSLNLVPGPAARIRVETSADGSGTLVQAQTLNAGASLTGYAIARDLAGNFLENIAADSWDLSASSGGVTGAALSASMDGKSAVFSSTAVGTGVLRANSSTLTEETSGTITVQAAALAGLQLFTQPSATATAGSAFATQPVIRLLDAYGNLRTQDNGTAVTVARSAGTGTLQGTLTRTASAGVVTFSGLFHTVANPITLAFSSTGVSTIFSNTVTVSPAAASKLTFTVQPTNSLVGTPIDPAPVVRIQDTYGNNVSQSGTTITVSRNSGGGNLAGTTAVATDANGAATFSNIYFNNAGTRTLQAAATGLTSAISNSYITYANGVLASFRIEAEGGGAIGAQTAGVPFNIRITAVDGADTPLSSFTGTVTISSSGTLSSGAGTTAAFVSGVLASHTVTLTTAGAITLTATQTSGSISGTSDAITVGPAAVDLAQSVITVSESAIIANGSATTVATLQLKDAFGNNRVTGGETVVISTTNGTFTGLTSDTGTGTFTRTLTAPTTVGSATLSATVNGNPVTGGDATVTFIPGPLHNFLVEAAAGGAIATQTAGVSFPIRITARDATGNTVTAFTSAVTLTSTRTFGSGGGTTAAFSSGVLASHTVALTQSGSATLTATSGLVATTSAAFTVNPAAASTATTLITASPPFILNNGSSTSTISVQAIDAFGNPLTSSGGTVVLSDNGAASLSAVTDNGNGTYTATLTSTTTVETVTLSGTINGNAITDVATVTITQFNEWRSASQNNRRTVWNNAGNWSLGVVPTSTHVVVIPTNPANGTGFPVLEQNYTGTFVVIAAGALLTVNAGYTLDLSGNLEGDGTFIGDQATVTVGGDLTVANFNAATSSVALDGTGAQTVSGELFIGSLDVATTAGGVAADGYLFIADNLTIQAGRVFTLATGSTLEVLDIGGAGTLQAADATLLVGGTISLPNLVVDQATVEYNGTAPQTNPLSSFANLRINNSGGVVSAVDIQVSGTLTLSAGTLTMESGTDLVANTKSIGSGDLRLRRMLEGGAGYRMLSSPIPTTYGDFMGGTRTQGYTGATFPALQPNVLWYDETYEGTDNQRWRTPASSGDAVSAGRGHLVYLFDQLPDTLEVIGLEHEGNSGIFDFNVTYTALADTGWNLVGNPFAATLDWDDEAEWTKTNMDNTFHIWDAADSTYKSWNGTAGSHGSGLIAPFQAFWVKANASPSLTANRQAKTVGGGFRRHGVVDPVIRLGLEAGGYRAETWFHFSHSGLLGKDTRDAYSLQPLSRTYAEVESRIGRDYLDIQHLPNRFGIPLEIPFEATLVADSAPDSSRLVWDLGSAVPLSWELELVDAGTGSVVDMRSTTAYRFPLHALRPKARPDSAGTPLQPLLRTASHPESRFLLRITPTETDPDTPDGFAVGSNYPNPFNPSTIIRFEIPVESRVRVEVFDITGRSVALLIDESRQAGYYELPWDASALASGVYLYRVSSRFGSAVRKMTLLR